MNVAMALGRGGSGSRWGDDILRIERVSSYVVVQNCDETGEPALSGPRIVR